VIGKLAEEFSIKELCRLFDVARSGYYSWKSRGHGKRSIENRRLQDDIRRIHQESDKTYGVPRITPALRILGYRCGHNRVARLMKQMNVHGIAKRRFRPQTTESRHDLPVSPNLLKNIPALTAPDQAWVADITYIRTEEGWLYLAAIMDLWSRTIVGWQTSNSLKSELVTDALHKAIDRRRPQQGLIHHSDRGKQYASAACRTILASAKIASSMTFTGNCYDNAAMESFWSTLKTEMVYRKRFQFHEDAHLAIFDYIEVFYNRKRLHSALGYRSPLEFESLCEKNVFTVPQVSTFSG
jgi:transposase InsO family protein